MSNRLIGGILAVILMWGAIQIWRSLSGEPVVVEETIEAESTLPLHKTPTPIPESEVPEVLAEAPATPVIESKPATPFQFQSELEVYSKIRQKVLLTDEETAMREKLLRQAELLRALGQRLLEVTENPGVMASQNVAVDLLLDAMDNGDRQVASEALKTVIEDAQVENAGLPRNARENMAGVKAEVMHRWSARAPEEMGYIEGRLPGPVSRKIWQNVLNHQSNNLAEVPRTGPRGH